MAQKTKAVTFSETDYDWTSDAVIRKNWGSGGCGTGLQRVELIGSRMRRVSDRCCVDIGVGVVVCRALQSSGSQSEVGESLAAQWQLV